MKHLIAAVAADLSSAIPAARCGNSVTASTHPSYTSLAEAGCAKGYDVSAPVDAPSAHAVYLPDRRKLRPARGWGETLHGSTRLGRVA